MPALTYKELFKFDLFTDGQNPMLQHLMQKARRAERRNRRK